MSPLAVEFAVVGLPPVNAEGESILAPDHPHARRVLDLLRAAQDAIASSGWSRDDTSYLRLELTVRSATRTGCDPLMALAAVADVLEDKEKDWTVNLDHLADLDEVALFNNRRQVAEVTYRESAGEQASYTLRLFRLDDALQADGLIESFATVQCPEPTAPLDELLSFAITYDTYERLASDLGKLKEMVDPVVKALETESTIPGWVGIDILRGMLFGYQRATHWQDYVSAEEEKYMRRLVAEIAKRSEGRPLLWDYWAV